MSLPPELLEYAFEFVDELPPLFLVSQQFYSIAKQRCYRHLRFTSKQRLTSFVEQFQDGAPPLVLHTLELDIPNSGQHNGPGVFEQLHSLFCCMRNGLLKEEEDAPPSESRFGLAGFIVDCIRICMNSHFDDPDNDYIPMAFIGVSPKAFIWTGRDPPSHFSIAIVPTALKELLSFLPFFTHLTHLELSHVNFLEPSPLPQFPQLAKIHSLPIIPSLRTLKLSCAIHVNPKSIVRLIGCREMQNLQQVHLVDNYIESIWGSRLRGHNLELAAGEMLLGGADWGVNESVSNFSWDSLVNPEDRKLTPLEYDETMERVRRLVLCEALTERIIGGDRADSIDTNEMSPE